MIPDTVFTLAKAKEHLRVDHSTEDALITAMLDAAVGAVERYTRRAWTKRAWATPLDGCDFCGCDSPTFHALLSPATVKSFELEGAAVPATSYATGTRYGHSFVRYTGTPPTITAGDVGAIEWEAEPLGVPPDVYAACMLYLGDLYENREANIVGIALVPNPTAELLMRPYVIEMHA